MISNFVTLLAIKGFSNCLADSYLRIGAGLGSGLIAGLAFLISISAAILAGYTIARAAVALGGMLLACCLV